MLSLECGWDHASVASLGPAPPAMTFARNYGGAEGAVFVRDAMRAYAERNL